MLDFIIIGAQKCSTTSLWLALREQEELILPGSKENHVYNKKICNIEHKLSTNGKKKLYGKVSPNYSINWATRDRLYSLNSNMNIIFVIRDPLQRLVSHYKMVKRRKLFDGDIDQWVNYLLDLNLDFRDILWDDDTLDADTGLIRGRYCDIIRYWSDKFDITVLSASDFNKEQIQTVNLIRYGLGLDPTTKHTYHHAHRGTTSTILPTLPQINKSPFGKLVKKLIPRPLRTVLFPKRLRFLYDIYNVKKSQGDEDIKLSSGSVERLMTYYSEEFRNLGNYFE